jgi:ABC-2 type transport system permease protein
MFSFARFKAMVVKEFRQMRRDRLTFAMMVGIPLMQLILFGYAIQTDPKHLPAALLIADHSPMSRSIAAALKSSDYFDIQGQAKSEAQADEMLDTGKVQFVIQIPPDFYRDLVRGERPALLLSADATDPMAVAHAMAAIDQIVQDGIDRDLTGPLAILKPSPSTVDVRVHARYNPESNSQYDIVPGLMGVVLTMTLVIITALAMTKEREQGTMENLLTTPVKPLEVMTGKLTPYILVGYLQIALILIAAKLIFRVPTVGNIGLLALESSLFIAANLAVGITFSTVAKNQLQAVQMSFFFFLPSILLSGFMFPFRGMPVWAQYLGSCLPLTHYLRLVRGILLKGNTMAQTLDHLWPMALFLLVILFIGLKRYRQTLD